MSGSVTPPKPPRSRALSRSTTPAPMKNPARLTIPLRPTHSLSNLHIHDHRTPSPPGVLSVVPTQESLLDSCASSVVEADGILLRDAEPDAETGAIDDKEVVAVGTLTGGAGDADSKRTLRAQLRKTLNQGSDLAASRTWQKDKASEMQDLPHSPEARYPPREYFVLTDAGKPVFTTRPDSPDLGSILGILQALISVFLDDSDKLRCINAGRTRIAFLLRSPLYYVCVSSWGEPESVTRSHLEYLHLQILSVVSAAQLQRIFERRGNFDLRRLLNGAEIFMTSLLINLDSDLALSTSSLHVLRVEDTLRKRAARALLPSGARVKEVLYIILVAKGKVVTLARPKKHSIHPADIHILLNTIHAPSIFSSPAAASWIPVCLPRFNPNGFVNVYVEFLGRNEASGSALIADITPTADIVPHPGSQNDPGITLVCVSGGGQFETIRSLCASITMGLESDGCLAAIMYAVHTGSDTYPVSQLGIPGLRHFLYKSRGQVQITLPIWEDPYEDASERRRLITLYQVLHDAIHGKSGQGGTLKLQYIRTDKESVLGWITQPFELYIALSPRLPKSAAVGAANAVAKWVKQEESRVFLRDAPIF